MEFNTFSDRDCERIGAVVRQAESKVGVPFERRPPPVPPAAGMWRVKTKAACSASNASTGQLTNVNCDVYDINPSTGACTDAGWDMVVWNGGGAIATNTFADVALNRFNMPQFVVVICGS